MKISTIQNTILLIYVLILSPLIINFVYINYFEDPEEYIVSVKTEVERIPYTNRVIDSLFIEKYHFSCNFEKLLNSINICSNDTIYTASIIVEVFPDSLRREEIVFSSKADKIAANGPIGYSSEEIALNKFEKYKFKHLEGQVQFIQRFMIKEGYIREVSYLKTR